MGPLYAAYSYTLLYSVAAVHCYNFESETRAAAVGRVDVFVVERERAREREIEKERKTDVAR